MLMQLVQAQALAKTQPNITSGLWSAAHTKLMAHYQFSDCGGGQNTKSEALLATRCRNCNKRVDCLDEIKGVGGAPPPVLAPGTYVEVGQINRQQVAARWPVWLPWTRESGTDERMRCIRLAVVRSPLGLVMAA